MKNKQIEAENFVSHASRYAEFTISYKPNLTFFFHSKFFKLQNMLAPIDVKNQS